MPRLAEDLLSQALPYFFRLFNFRVYQEDREHIILEHEGEMVDRFDAYVEIHTLVSDCQDHLTREHGYDKHFFN